MFKRLIQTPIVVDDDGLIIFFFVILFCTSKEIEFQFENSFLIFDQERHSSTKT